MFLARIKSPRIRLPRRWAAVLAAAACAIVPLSLTTAASSASAGPPVAQWPSGGQNIGDTRSNMPGSGIPAAVAGKLAVAWTIPTRGEVSATPAVVDGALYFPDWAGEFVKASSGTGQVVWTHQISDYTGVPGDVSRTSPAVANGVVYLGDQGGTKFAGARLAAVDAATGGLLWSTQIESHVAGLVTQSPVVYGGVVYVGVSSQEEGLAAAPGGYYHCCTFRGSVVALDAATGRILWQTYTVPDNGGVPGGYTGGAVWGGTPAIDPVHHLLYVGTGNNYTVPQAAADCQSAGGTPARCLSPDDHIDSILALDLNTGAVVWSVGTGGFDAWNDACDAAYPTGNCPQNPGHDADFADGMHLFSAQVNGVWHDVLGAGQKSGEYWLLDALTGQILWSAAPGPGGGNGGIQWGTATDGRRIYVAESDSDHHPYTLPNGQTITTGSFAALDASTGKVLWQVADPTGGSDQAAVSTADGVVYAGSSTGMMFALDAGTGAILWTHQGQGASMAGPAIAGRTVFWGNGYPDRLRFPPVATPSVLYAFALPHGG